MKIISRANRIIVLILMALVCIALIASIFLIGIDNFTITGSSHVGSNIACCIVMFSMCFGLTRSMYENSKTMQLFLGFIFLVFICCAAESLAWIMNVLEPEAVAWEYVKAGVLIISHLSIIIIIFFVIKLIGGITKKFRFDFKIIAILCFIYIAFIICFSTFGGYFSIVDGQLVCDNADMGMLVLMTVVIDIFLVFILKKSKASKKWIYVIIDHAITMMVLLFICFLFDSPTIIHMLNCAFVAFAYCTVFVEISAENKELAKSFGKYLETINQSALIANTGNVENAKIAIVVCQIHNMRNLSYYFESGIVVDIYNIFLEKANEIAIKHRGILMQPIGFEIKCIFKYGSDIDNRYVYDAIDAAKAILTATEEINDYNRTKKYPSVYVGIAVDEGESFIGSVGGAGRFQYTASGELVNNCYFMETNCSEGEILISENVVAATGDALHITDNRKIKVPNSDEYINAYRLGF